jgi:hypothetical protein
MQCIVVGTLIPLLRELTKDVSHTAVHMAYSIDFGYQSCGSCCSGMYAACDCSLCGVCVATELLDCRTCIYILWRLLSHQAAPALLASVGWYPGAHACLE